jgi:hypothetical protein
MNNKEKLFNKKKRRSINTYLKYLLLFVGALCFVIGAWLLTSQLKEMRIVDAYLHHIFTGVSNVQLTRTNAIKVSKFVRADFNVDEKTFTCLHMDQRPFLRNEVDELLRIKEGLCGEGARVLVVLLQHLGYDTTRLTLYNRRLQSAHTLVSVIIGGKEEFIDSINTGPWLNSFLDRNIINVGGFQVMHYSSDILTRRRFGESLHRTADSEHRTADYNKFFTQFWLYSYEAIPYSKLLSKIGFDLRVFNFSRPTKWISFLAESPKLIRAICFFAFSIFLFFVAWMLHLRSQK